MIRGRTLPLCLSVLFPFPICSREKSSSCSIIYIYAGPGVSQVAGRMEEVEFVINTIQGRLNSDLTSRTIHVLVYTKLQGLQLQKCIREFLFFFSPPLSLSLCKSCWEFILTPCQIIRISFFLTLVLVAVVCKERNALIR